MCALSSRRSSSCARSSASVRSLARELTARPTAAPRVPGRSADGARRVLPPLRMVAREVPQGGAAGARSAAATARTRGPRCPAFPRQSEERQGPTYADISPPLIGRAPGTPAVGFTDGSTATLIRAQAAGIRTASRSGFRPPACTARRRRHDAAAASAARGLPGLRRGGVPRASGSRASHRAGGGRRCRAAAAQDWRCDGAPGGDRRGRGAARHGRRALGVRDPASRRRTPTRLHGLLGCAAVADRACGWRSSGARSHHLQWISGTSASTRGRITLGFHALRARRCKSLVKHRPAVVLSASRSMSVAVVSERRSTPSEVAPSRSNPPATAGASQPRRSGRSEFGFER